MLPATPEGTPTISSPLFFPYEAALFFPQNQFNTHSPATFPPPPTFNINTSITPSLGIPPIAKRVGFTKVIKSPTINYHAQTEKSSATKASKSAVTS